MQSHQQTGRTTLSGVTPALGRATAVIFCSSTTLQAALLGEGLLHQQQLPAYVYDSGSPAIDDSDLDGCLTSMKRVMANADSMTSSLWRVSANLPAPSLVCSRAAHFAQNSFGYAAGGVLHAG